MFTQLLKPQNIRLSSEVARLWIQPVSLISRQFATVVDRRQFIQSQEKAYSQENTYSQAHSQAHSQAQVGNNKGMKSIDNIVTKVNNLKWEVKAKLVKEDNNICVTLLMNLNKLSDQTIVCGVSNSKIFAEGVAVNIIQNNNINLYLRLCTQLPVFASTIINNISGVNNKRMVNFVFEHMSDIKHLPLVIESNMCTSVLFCELMAQKCSQDLTVFDYLSSNATRTMLSNLPLGSKQLMFNAILDNSNLVPISVIRDAINVNCHFTNDTFNERITKKIINVKGNSNIKHSNWSDKLTLLYWLSDADLKCLIKGNKLVDQLAIFVVDNVYIYCVILRFLLWT